MEDRPFAILKPTGLFLSLVPNFWPGVTASGLQLGSLALAPGLGSDDPDSSPPQLFSPSAHQPLPSQSPDRPLSAVDSPQ